MRRMLVAAALPLVLAASARADSLADTFARANAAYARGAYEQAVDEYQTLIDARVADPAVTYNLASAHARQGHYGQAIRYYERTLLLAPGDDSAEQALKLVRDALGEQQARERGEAIVAERPPLSSALFAGLHADTWAWLLLVSSWLACGAVLAMARARAEAQRIALGITSSVFFVLGAISGFGLWAKSDFGAEGTRAIVIQDRAALREGPDEAARMASELSEGEAVRILATDSRFAHIRLGRGGEGFVAKAAVGEI